MPSGSCAEDFLFGNLGWVGTSPRLLTAQATFNRQRGNLAGKLSLAHSHFFYGIVFKRELEPYSLLLVIVPWEPGVNRPSLRWVGWSFKEPQRFTHPFLHNQLGENSGLGARFHQECRDGPSLALVPAGCGRGWVALLPKVMPHRQQWGSSISQSHTMKPLLSLYWSYIGHCTPNSRGARTERQRFGARRE